MEEKIIYYDYLNTTDTCSMIVSSYHDHWVLFNSDELEHDIRRMQQDHLRKMHELQRQIESLRHENLRISQPSKVIIQPPPPPVQVN